MFKKFMTKKALEAKLATGDIVKDENGNFFTEHGVAIVIVLVVGAAVLLLVGGLWDSDGTIGKAVSEKINEMFN